MVWYDDPIVVVAVALVIIIAAGAVIFAMRRYSTKKSEPKPPQQKTPPQTQPQTQSTVDLQYPSVPFRISKSVQGTMANSAKDELRMLDLEREILGDAIRRLYEAQAEGKITETWAEAATSCEV